MHKIKADEDTLYYLYRHLKKDTLTPFYVGIATKRKYHSACLESEYERAYVVRQRSEFWLKTFKKYGRVVEILYECADRRAIVEKEKEFIRLYGRRDIKTGILVNLTDGGEDVCNISPETELLRRQKISKALKNRVRKKSTFIKISESKKKSVYKCDFDFNIIEEFDSISEAATNINLTISSISKCLKNKKYSAGGFKWVLKTFQN